MVRTTLILSVAMLASAPASAVTLMDSVPEPAPQGAPADPVTPNGPYGHHAIIKDFENTLRDGMQFASLKNAFNALPPVAGNAANVIAEPDAAAVPEPATWAMMLGGFGFAGLALRRRSLRTTASLSR